MIGAKDEVKSDKIEVSFAVASVFDRSHVDQGDIDDAVAAIERAFPRLAHLKGVVQLEFGDDVAWTVDARDKPTVTVGRSVANPDCTITIHPRDIVRFFNGEMTSRHALWFKAMKVDGSVATAVKFGDLLQRDDITNRPVVDLPNLPSPTEDLAKIRSDLDQFGYALLANALSPAEVAAARERLFEQADAEREAGIGLFDGGASLPNQRVVNLMNKGTEFVELLNHPIIDVIVKEVLGDYFLLGSYTANIAGPGSESQTLHTDQMWMIPPNDSHAMGINLAFFLDDVTEENGGTRLLPGSHKGTLRPEHPLVVTEETVAAAGPAGTILLFESRTFHGTGANVSKNSLRPVILMFFVRYFIRPQENAFFSIDPELEATLSDRLKTMLGYRVTYTVGGVDGAATEGSMAKRPDKLTGIMKPKKKREAAGR